MTDEQHHLDHELAAFTDRLLAGEDAAPPSGELRDLAATVRQIHAVVTPDAAPEADAALKKRLAGQLRREWERQPRPVGRPVRSWRTNRRVQVAALAASLTVLLVVIALLAGSSGDGSVQGTASEPSTLALGGAVLVGGALLAWWWVRARR